MACPAATEWSEWDGGHRARRRRSCQQHAHIQVHYSPTLQAYRMDVKDATIAMEMIQKEMTTASLEFRSPW